jgi:hypothetical protein
MEDFVSTSNGPTAPIEFSVSNIGMAIVFIGVGNKT